MAILNLAGGSKVAPTGEWKSLHDGFAYDPQKNNFFGQSPQGQYRIVPVGGVQGFFGPKDTASSAYEYKNVDPKDLAQYQSVAMQTNRGKMGIGNALSRAMRDLGPVMALATAGMTLGGPAASGWATGAGESLGGGLGNAFGMSEGSGLLSGLQNLYGNTIGRLPAPLRPAVNKAATNAGMAAATGNDPLKAGLSGFLTGGLGGLGGMAFQSMGLPANLGSLLTKQGYGLYNADRAKDKYLERAMQIAMARRGFPQRQLG